MSVSEWIEIKIIIKYVFGVSFSILLHLVDDKLDHGWVEICTRLGTHYAVAATYSFVRPFVILYI